MLLSRARTVVECSFVVAIGARWWADGLDESVRAQALATTMIKNLESNV